MKKLINDKNNIVEEVVEGMIKAFPDKLSRVENEPIIIRKNKKVDKVALISGGGSGHEPAHAGFVGHGMLDAAVCGEIFTSPGADKVYNAIKAVDGGKGVLLIIKNYSGDIMNFEMAGEMAQAEGINVKQVVVDDDIAVENSTYTVGRRGIAGTIFVHKILGAAAEKGYDLGIHGEPGTHREKMATANEFTEKLFEKIYAESNPQKGDRFAVLVNGLGETTLIELFIINNHLQDLLKAKGIEVAKTLVGNYMTSLDMGGFSITLLKLDNEMEELLKAEEDTIAF